MPPRSLYPALIACFGIGLLASQHIPEASACSCVGGGQLSLERASVELIDGEAGQEAVWHPEGSLFEEWGTFTLYFESPYPQQDIYIRLRRVP